MNQRELFKLAPILALRALAILRFQGAWLKKGLTFRDLVSALDVSKRRPATTFTDPHLTLAAKFPINKLLSSNHSYPESGVLLRPKDCCIRPEATQT
jgi:hypothetical protein